MFGFKHDPRLPVGQLAILSVARFAEPIAFTSIYPYLPEMMQSFGVPEDDVSIYVGWASTIFSFTQCFSALLWARASDVFGRKYTIVTGLSTAMVLMLGWGFSSSVQMALTMRAIQGLANGNVGIIRTMVVEMCPWPDLHYRTFSIMPMVWNLGAMIGPMIGGLLANPFGVQPGRPHCRNLLEIFPYALPNIVVSCIFFMGIVCALLFLEETMDGLKDKPDRPLQLGKKVQQVFTSLGSKTGDREREPLLQKPDDTEAANGKPNAPKQAKLTFLQSLSGALTLQSTLALASYTMLALYSLGHDNLMPVLLHRTYKGTEGQSFWLFDTGFGLSTRRIGILTSVYSLCALLVQATYYTPVARHFGALKVSRTVHLLNAFFMIITPFTVLLPTNVTRQIAVFACMLGRTLCGVFAFPSAVIILTNSCQSKQTLGTLNGISVSLSAIGRGLGPFIGGKLFSYGTDHKIIALPFYGFFLIALLGFTISMFMRDVTFLAGDETPTAVDEEDDVLGSSEAERDAAGGLERVRSITVEAPDAPARSGRRGSALERVLSQEQPK